MSLPCALLPALSLASVALAAPAPYRIEVSTLVTGRGTQLYTQSRAALIPGATPRVIVTTQETDPTGAHGYKDMFYLETADLGRTWSPLQRIDSLRRTRRPEGHDFVIGDVCPQWHAATQRVLATGKTFGFLGGTKEDRGLERVSYAVFHPQTNRWSELRLVDLPAQDHEGRPFLEPNSGCHQRVDLPNGEILLPIRYRKDPAVRYYTTIVARCRFDGEKLTYLEHGSEFMIPRERGLYEPSVAAFGGKFFLTMRADHSAFVARSRDGLRYEPFIEWKRDDGAVLGSYNTQQHWLVHGDTLYLLYTRRGANNDHVMRHRAPLFIAEVDPERLVVRRATERIVFPEENADLGAGFGVLEVSPHERWVVTSEIPTKGSRDYGRVMLARLTWGEAGKQ
ncbi:MAG: exo-alpha-sialidase [Verrucomicrobia bacterium]|nr:exo-alpha-sialidase [Verrucomicrobiota bacterium]